jgi:hypothetical protein
VTFIMALIWTRFNDILMGLFMMNLKFIGDDFAVNLPSSWRKIWIIFFKFLMSLRKIILINRTNCLHNRIFSRKLNSILNAYIIFYVALTLWDSFQKPQESWKKIFKREEIYFWNGCGFLMTSLLGFLNIERISQEFIFKLGKLFKVKVI